jgi:uncharacterized protein (DUF885 family)
VKWALRAIGILSIGAAAFTAHVLWGRPLSIDWFFERELVRYGVEDPEILSLLGLLDATPFDFYNDELTDVSLAAIDRRYARWRESLSTLRDYDREALSPTQQTSYDYWEWFVTTQLEGERFKLHEYAIVQNRGAYLDLVDFLGRVHRIADLDGARDFLTRLGQVAVKLDQQLEVSRAQTALGVVPPRFILEKTLVGLRNIRDVAPTESPYVVSFRERLAAVEGLDDEARAALVEEAVGLVRDSTHPAYDRTIAHVEALLPKATDDAGVWALPDGDAYYRHLIRSMTSTDLTSEEIHAIGLAEVARIESEMTAILAAEGLTDAPLPELLRRLLAEERFLLPDTDASREQRVREYQAIIDEIDAGIRSAFHRVPSAPLEVRRIPPYREASATSHYSPASLDGTRPAVFFAKLAEIPASWTMRTLAYHEGTPGHHFQIGIANELEGLPTFRRVLPITVFVEGWALYAERLAWEMGYQQDPFDDLGRLRDENFRAVRLVVDTGLHHFRWTRQQALDYMEAHTGDPKPSEIDRYCVWPGQALAYKIGMLEILELRERARERLGDRFPLADFHEVVIGNGALPLPILERLVDEWIARQR